MNKMKLNRIILLVLCPIMLLSCVSQKKYQSLENEHKGLKGRYDALDTKSNEMQALIEQLKREKQLMQADVDKIDGLNRQISLLKNNIAEIEALQNQLKSSNQGEIASLLKQLQKEKEELQQKEDELRERNKKLIDLQAALDNKEQAVKDLRKKVSNALLGFEGKGLTIEQKGGNVYVSMDEKLLFKSGKYDIEQGGVDALKQLGKVLDQNTDINIMVEGHTDSFAYKGTSNLTDNWDLSVKRATTVVRTLLKESSINPIRVIAAGHSEYAPINTNKTAEGRQHNRRTEIILTPKIDELLKVLDNN